MKIITKGNLGHKIPEYYIQTFSLLFFPEDGVFGKKSQSENFIKIFVNEAHNFVDISVEICYNKKTASKSAKTKESRSEDLLTYTGKLFYGAGGEITGIYPPWGIHTGIRPAKTAGEIFEKNNSDEKKTLDRLRGDYLMSEGKSALALKTYKNAKAAAGVIGEKDFSLYISIPFCPTRCRYCSFVSFATPGLLKLIPEYVKKLTEEIKITGEITRDMKLKTIYIGGGTPTALEDKFLETILLSIKENFDFSNLSEYTAECGRPDTITAQKLELFKSFGVDRVSVNPQTLNDSVLKQIGRPHTAEDFFKAFETARKSEIKNINTDCIIGLTGESKPSMLETASALSSLKPENITVHSLCLKKSSELKSSEFEKTLSQSSSGLNETLDDIYEILSLAGYKPYYMYRQKYAAGNLENTGFCLDGRECLYNIYMMDELMSIFGAGAGAMTKIVKGGRIERAANYKYPYEYIGRDFQINSQKNIGKLKILRD
ncbi:MAG: coproporphyrinogen dehydrogenase HemZ [Oscillospiraceae bacterium]|nr:coproporphyrinogen dehydrogenase HemZ [Oscillospiraceae bacterium]